MQLTEKWLKETLERNPQLKVKVQGGRNSEVEQPEEVEKPKTKYGNHRVYLYEDEYVSGDKYISGHGKLVAVFDSTKEYCRWLDLQLMEKAGTISNLERQKELVIQDAFVYEKKRVQRIVYKADFCYSDAKGKTIVEDVKGFDSKSGKYMQTEAFRLKWKLLKAKYPEYHFVLV